MTRKKSNVVKYKKPIKFNIGVVIFLFIFVYVVVISLSYAAKTKIAMCEVTEKKIADDNTCQGIVIRQEQLFTTKKSGYLNYFVGDGSRVGKGSTIYALDTTGNSYDIISSSDNAYKMTKEEINNIRTGIASFQKNYTDSTYNQINSFVFDMDNEILQLNNASLLENMETILSESKKNAELNIVNSEFAGIVSYSMDGLENITVDDVTVDTFSLENYERVQLRTTEQVENGQTAYKLILSEDWSLVLSLSKEQFETLQKKEQEQVESGYSKGYVTTTFVKQGLEVFTSFSLFEKENGYFARMDFTKYLNYFVNDRFVEVELSLNSAKGLKIPNSSILEKDFNKVPLTYFTKEKETGKEGLVKENYANNGEMEEVFIPVTIFYSDEEFAYIDHNDIKRNDWIINVDTKERYQITEIGTLEGVYNVNNGYAVFRRIERVYNNAEYCIIKKETSYGVSAYDHIVVDATTISENDIIK